MNVTYEFCCSSFCSSIQNAKSQGFFILQMKLESKLDSYKVRIVKEPSLLKESSDG